MKDEYKIIKSISIFPWKRFEVWAKGLQWDCSTYVPKEIVTTRCVHSARTEQKAQDFIDYWENISEFKLGEKNETI
jgi:hypothetical protein